MKYLELFCFAGQCLTLKRFPERRDEIRDVLLNDAFNWVGFIRLISNQYIMPAIYVNFRDAKLLDVLPVEIAEHLHEIHQLNTERNRQIVTQMEEITRVLHQYRIKPVYLKGTANLLDGIYTDPGERMIGDIDFLVTEKDYLKAAELVLALGYENPRLTLVDVNDLKHYPRLWKKDVPADVEIHRRVVPDKHNGMLSPQMVESATYETEVLQGAYVPSIEHRIIHNFIHQHLTDKGHVYGQTSLRNVYDLFLLAEKTETVSIANQLQAKNRAIAYFCFAQYCLGLPGYFYPEETAFAKRFRLRVGFFSRHHRLYKLNKTIFYLGGRFEAYFEQIAAFFYKKSIRKSLIRRLSSRAFYREHFAGYRDFFHR